MHTQEDRDDPATGSETRRFAGLLGRDTLRYLPSTLIPALVSLLYITTFTRVFPPDEFGRYTVVFVTCMIAVNTCGGWIMQSVIRYLPRYRSRGELGPFLSMLSALLLAALAVLAALLAVVLPVVRAAAPGYAAYYPWAALMVLSGVAVTVLKTIFQANLQSRSYARVEVAFALGRFVVALGFVFLVSRSAVGLIAGPAVAYAALAIVMIPWHRLPATVRRHRDRFRLTLLPLFLRYGVPMIGWMVGVKVLEVSDRYVVEYFRGPAEVGVYSANYSIASMGMWLVATPLLLAAHPLIVSAWESGARPRIQDIITTFSRYYLLCAVPLAVFAGVFAGDLAEFLLGSEFHAGYAVIPVVIAGLLLWNLGFYGHKAIKLLEKTRIMVAMVVVCAAANIGLNILLVPGLGYMGAAWATLASMALYPLMVSVVTRRFLPWRIPWLTAARVALAAAAAGAVGAQLVSVLPAMPALARLAVGFAAGAAAYGIVVVLLREVGAKEIRAATRVLKGGGR